MKFFFLLTHPTYQHFLPDPALNIEKNAVQADQVDYNGHVPIEYFNTLTIFFILRLRTLGL